MNLSELRQKTASGLTADWLFNDLVSEMTMFECLNLANCAAERAKQAAAIDSDRFRSEYYSSQLWIRMANDFIV